MKRIVTLSILFLSVFVVYGAIDCDSIKVYFALDKSAFDPSLNNNAASMLKFIDGVTVAAENGTLDHIDITGYASPEGPFRNNERLAEKRCDAIARLVSENAGIPMDIIHTYSGGVAWDGLRSLVISNPGTPARDEVLQILNEYIPEACTDRDLSDKCRKDLIAIDNGISYDWMLENLFPLLRYSLSLYAYSIQERIITLEGLDNIEFCTLPCNIDENIEILVPEEICHAASMSSIPPLHRLAIKTNLLYDAALLPNLEVEWRFNDKWSVALEGDVAWWGSYSKLNKHGLVVISPELKRWFRPRAPWHGFYLGLFAGGGYYDFEKTTRGYRGEGAMVGLSAGYMWPIGRNLSLEAELGVGYLYSKCKEYIPMDGHLVYQLTKNINYFGPLKAKFSIVWRLWDSNKSRRQNLKKWKEGFVVQYEK